MNLKMNLKMSSQIHFSNEIHITNGLPNIMDTPTKKPFFNKNCENNQKYTSERNFLNPFPPFNVGMLNGYFTGRGIFIMCVQIMKRCTSSPCSIFDVILSSHMFQH